MRVHIGSDHAGFELKQHLVAALTTKGYEVVDHGAAAYDAQDDYPTFCLPAAEAVVADPGSLGIVIGGSGNGEAIAANKVPGIRATVAHDSFSVERSILSNDCQILTMGQRVIGLQLARRLAAEWLGYAFDPTSHSNRNVSEIVDYEDSLTD